jgi:hypothetical protein
MKTKKNVYQIAQMSIISAGLIFFGCVMPLQAKSSDHPVKSRAIEAASYRLENLNNTIEKSIKFEAPSVNADVEASEFETNEAMERLVNLNNSIEKSIKFEAPASDLIAEAI